MDPLEYLSQAVAFFLFLDTAGIEKFARLFWVFLLLEFPRYVVLDFFGFLLTKWDRYRKRGLYQDMRDRLYRERPLVSVLVPGKDEGDNIPQMVRSLREQTYDNLEVVIIDDGSTDQTPLVCRGLLKEGLIQKYLRNRIRGGKASAANFGLRESNGEFVVHIDADCSFDRDAIEKILLPFYLDTRIGAVAGNLKVRNRHESLCTELQGIEYLKSISIGRRVASLLGFLRLVSGAFGAFRRDVLVQVGGWDVGPGLDGDITIKIRKSGYRVVFEHEAICFTRVPHSFTNLARQRLRWNRSLVRFRLRKHRNIFRPHEGFSFTTFLSSFENIFFNVVLNALWFVYIADILIHFPARAKFIIPVNYFLYLTVNILEMVVILWASERKRDEASLAFYLPLMPPYVAVYMRFIRTFAYLQELFTKASYRDPWNPWKVSKKARETGM